MIQHLSCTCMSTVGSNTSGCSGIDNTARNTIGGEKCIITPRKIEALCKKQIANIVCGAASFVLAVTESGKVYSWGYNSNYELGHGSNPPNAIYIPTIITNLNQFQVKQVACGSDHSMALTGDGKVRTYYCMLSLLLYIHIIISLHIYMCLRITYVLKVIYLLFTLYNSYCNEKPYHAVKTVLLELESYLCATCTLTTCCLQF